jgi:hypothetical protein
MKNNDNNEIQQQQILYNNGFFILIINIWIIHSEKSNNYNVFIFVYIIRNKDNEIQLSNQA